jgi:hypothetical protein
VPSGGNVSASATQQRQAQESITELIEGSHLHELMKKDTTDFSNALTGTTR